jgi:hypothetical protein
MEFLIIQQVAAVVLEQLVLMAMVLALVLEMVVLV